MQRTLGLQYLIVLVLGVLLAGSADAETADDIAAPEHQSFVPMTTSGFVRGSVFGVEMLHARPDHGLDRVTELGPAWVRRNGLLWKDVESIEGRGYRWTAPEVVALEREMIAVSERGLEMILVVRGSPRWATAPYTADCGPVHPDKYGRFAAFLAEAVKRYSRPPFNVRYWELGNEPDAPVGADHMFGCWGIPSDPYYGGRAYGAMLKAVYPAMKASNPDIQVLNGSLLLDRPTSPSSKFMEGLLLGGGGPYFDVLGFHSYCMYDPRDANGHDALYNSCASDWKIQFLRDLALRYRVQNKPMFRTEAALLCSVPHAACRQQQADFAARHFARTIRDGLLGSIWFTLESDSFRHSALLEPANLEQERASFVAMRQAAEMLGGATYRGDLTGRAPGVEGYTFERNGASTVVVWASKAQTTSIPVAPKATVECFDRDGQVLNCVNNQGSVIVPVETGATYVVAR